MDIKNVNSTTAFSYATDTTVSRGQSALPAKEQSVDEDAVCLSTKGLLSKDAFESSEDYEAYKNVMAAPQASPTTLQEAHGGLDPERVYRLLGLLE